MDATVNGVGISKLREITDAKGAVLHVRRNDDEDFTTFGECYCSEINPGEIKAWKIHEFQVQNIAVPVGRIRLVIFDPRETSTTKGILQVIELGRPDKYVRVKIPAGVWYGFKCLSTEKALLVNCTDKPHDQADNKKLPVDAPGIPYEW